MGRLIDLDTVPHRRVRFKTSNDSSSMVNELDVVFYEDLIQVPAVDAVPVVHGYNTKEDGYFHCSECGYGVADVLRAVKQKYVFLKRGKNGIIVLTVREDGSR